MKNNPVTAIIDIFLYFILFCVIQIATFFGVAFTDSLIHGNSLATAITAMPQVMQNLQLYGFSIALSTIITMVLFARLQWCPVSPSYLRSRPWDVFFWAFILALGTIIPSEGLTELFNFSMPQAQEEMLRSIMRQPWGWIVVGILVPVGEEMVFRGAILRRLTDLLKPQHHWVAISLSAFIFAIAHLNLAQGVHAFLIGLVFGWLYYRTGSILPGILIHWVNNMAAYVLIVVAPQMEDQTLLQIFGGNMWRVILAVAFSLCIFIPAVLQLNMRMKHADQ